VELLLEIRSVDILKNAGSSNLPARREHQLALLMFKVKNKMLPNHLTEIFTNTNSIHTHNTRNSEFNFALPKPKTNNMKKAFAYRGLRLGITFPGCNEIIKKYLLL
jgi:hypothetical protein